MQGDVASGITAGEARASLSEVQALRAEQARMKAEYDRMEVSQLQLCCLKILSALNRAVKDTRSLGLPEIGLSSFDPRPSKVQQCVKNLPSSLHLHPDVSPPCLHVNL